MSDTNTPGMQANNPNQTIRVRLTMRGLFTTTIRPGQQYSNWAMATLNVAEICDAPPGSAQGTRWGIGITLSPPHESILVDLMSEEWTFDYLESYKMVVFERTLPNGTFSRQCILLQDRSAFLILASVCASIKMFAYVGVMPT